MCYWLTTCFVVESDYIYWADSDHGTVTRIHRDGTGRQTVVEHFETMESVPVDWLTGTFQLYQRKNICLHFIYCLLDLMIFILYLHNIKAGNTSASKGCWELYQMEASS